MISPFELPMTISFPSSSTSNELISDIDSLFIKKFSDFNNSFVSLFFIKFIVIKFFKNNSSFIVFIVVFIGKIFTE